MRDSVKHLTEYAAGLGAGLFSVLVTFPINKLMFRQSAWGFDALTGIRQLRIEGARFLYRGVGPPLLIQSISSSAMFGNYDQFYRMLDGPEPGHDYCLSRAVIASVLSGGFGAAISTPFERVQVILQDGRYNNRYTNMWHAYHSLYRKYGWYEFFRGFQVAFARNVPTTFLYFGSLAQMEQNDMFGLGRHKNSGPGQTQTGKVFFERFLVGAILGAAISTLTYPMNAVRTRMQLQPPGTKHISFQDAARELIMERGYYNGLVAGLHANLFRAFLYWGCMTAGFDWLRRMLIG